MAEIFGEAWPDWPARGFRAHPAADRFSRRQLLHAQRHALRPRRLAAQSVRGAPEAVDLHRDGLGGLPAGPDRDAAVGQGPLRDIPLYITENGAAFFDPPTANDGRVEDPSARRLPARAHPRGARRDRAAVSMCAATWCGRCSTTSNGRSATRSASASCTSTSTARSARRRTARTFIRKSSRATEPFLAEKQFQRADARTHAVDGAKGASWCVRTQPSPLSLCGSRAAGLRAQVR